MSGNALAKYLESPPRDDPGNGASRSNARRGSVHETGDDRLARLHRYLNAYWLRPENAFWMTLRSLALSRCGFRRPSVDVACGDGVFSFLHAGGEFETGFDVFGAVGNLDRVTDEHADMFDAAADRFRPTILRVPGWQVDVGTDLKPALLKKAAALGFYCQLIEHDCNKPLPLDDAAFATVYCNSAYWVRGVDLLLPELRRITRPDGNVILHVKLAAMRDYTLGRFRDQLGQRFLEIIDRGRDSCWPTVATRGQWERRFQRAGLTVAEATPFVTRTHAHVWDIGLRPIAPLLVRMANALTPETRTAIKRDWVALFLDLLAPLCREDFDLFETHSEPAEVQYVLRPG